MLSGMSCCVLPVFLLLQPDLFEHVVKDFQMSLNIKMSDDTLMVHTFFNNEVEAEYINIAM